MLDWAYDQVTAVGLLGKKHDDEVIDERISKITAAVTVLLLVCSIVGNLAQKLNNDYWFSSDSLLAILLGFLASLPLCGENFNKVFKSFDTVFFLYLVPPILFEAGYALNQKDFFKNVTAIATLAVVGTCISSIVFGLSLFWLAGAGWIQGVSGTNPKEGLLFGSMMSATDPIATLAVMGSLDVEPQLYSLVFGESVINDAVAVVLFQTFKGLPDNETITITSDDASSAVINFFQVAIGSLVVGTVLGLVAAFITKRVINHSHPHTEVTIILGLGYLSFIAADDLGLSGLMAIFFCGVIMSHYAKYNLSVEGRETTHNVAKTLAYISETIVFLFFGFNILPTMSPLCNSTKSGKGVFELDWPFVGWSLLLCLVSRAVNIFPLTLMLNACKTSRSAQETKINFRSMTMIWFAGLRGAIAFALALTVNTESRKFIIPCVVVIILFTNIFLGQMTMPVLRLLKIRTFVNRDRQASRGSIFTRYESVGSFSMMNASFSGTSLFNLAQRQERATMHNMWRRFDDKYVKPIFGGRPREDLQSEIHRDLLSVRDAFHGRDGGELGGSRSAEATPRESGPPHNKSFPLKYTPPQPPQEAATLTQERENQRTKESPDRNKRTPSSDSRESAASSRDRRSLESPGSTGNVEYKRRVV